MKKIIVFALIAILAISCQKDPIGGTATQAISGEWSVIYDAVDADGNVIIPDVNGGYSRVLTFCTSKNAADSIFVADEQYFTAFQGKIPCNLGQMAFGSADMTDNLYGSTAYHGAGMIVNNGKILEGAATTPSGMPADSIYFELSFDVDNLPGMVGVEWDHYVVSGFRFTGLEGDQDGF